MSISVGCGPPKRIVYYATTLTVVYGDITFMVLLSAIVPGPMPRTYMVPNSAPQCDVGVGQRITHTLCRLSETILALVT